MSQEVALLASTFIPEVPYSQNLIAVYDSNFEQVFPYALIAKVSVRRPTKLMDHPLETGTETTDHRVILNTEIELPLILRPEYYKETYNNIIHLWETAELLTVQTKASVFNNQIIEEPPHEELAEIYNTIIINLKLRQVQIAVSGVSESYKNPTKGSTIDRGSIKSEPTEAVQEERISTLGKIVYSKKM